MSLSAPDITLTNADKNSIFFVFTSRKEKFMYTLMAFIKVRWKIKYPYHFNGGTTRTIEIISRTRELQK
jgi:hypothetical protein